MSSALFQPCALIGVLAVLLALPASPKSLAVIRADSTGLQYEVLAGPCTHGKCPILIRLMQGGRELDRQAIELLGSSADFRPTAFKYANGAGDPLATNTEDGQTYTGGVEEDSITVVIRRVRLTPELAGVLIDLRFGFEHLKRMHEIVAAAGGKLRKVWSAEEGAGPTYSTTALSGQPDGHDRLVYFSFFNYPDDGGADKISVTAFSYDSVTRSFQVENAPLAALLAGPYRSIGEARAARNHWKECRVPFWVLPGGALGSSPGGYVVATFSTSSPNLSRAAGSLKHCAAEATFSVYEVKEGSLSIW